jgi:hypothetical protein
MPCKFRASWVDYRDKKLMEMPTLKQTHDHEPVRAAQRIIGELIELRETIRTTAEGFAVLDFVQGHVATELPAATARDIIAIVRAAGPNPAGSYEKDLVLLWLEHYRRAYSQMIMRVLEDGLEDGIEPTTA